MNVFEAIVNRRSVRSYTGEPVTYDELDRLLTAANCAPIASARFHSKHLTVIRDKALLSEIEEAFDIEVSAAEMTPENFNSAAALWKMIERLQEN